MQYQQILLIDDDTEDQEIFKTALSQASKMSECTMITDAPKALNRLIKEELKPDVIFVDLNMPLMTGLDFLREVKKRDNTKNIPVIIFTTSSNPATVKLTKELGAIDFITKPDRFDKLVTMLKNIIQ